RILLLREFGMGSGRGREKALIDRSLVRAKLMEIMARYKGKRNTDEYFLTGLFSLIDIIMRQNIEDVLPQLSLSNTIVATLLGENTEITPYLHLTKTLEEFKLDTIKEQSLAVGIHEQK